MKNHQKSKDSCNSYISDFSKVVGRDNSNVFGDWKNVVIKNESEIHYQKRPQNILKKVEISGTMGIIKTDVFNSKLDHAKEKRQVELKSDLNNENCITKRTNPLSLKTNESFYFHPENLKSTNNTLPREFKSYTKKVESGFNYGTKKNSDARSVMFGSKTNIFG